MVDIKDQKINIFYIEDNLGDVELLKKAFEIAGIDISLTTAKDGDIALKMLNREAGFSDLEDPDIILLDLNLPKKDGSELLKEIKANSELKHLPILIYTSSKSARDITESYYNYANGYVVKPSDKQSLEKTANTIVNFWAKSTRLS